MKQAEMAKWLRIMVLFTGAVGLVFLVLVVPRLIQEVAGDEPRLFYLVRPGFYFCWVTAVPIFVMLYKVWQICGEISRNNSFSHRNALLLRDISLLCLLDCAIYLVAGIVLLALGHFDLLVLGLLFGIILIGIFVAVVCAALSHLTDKASVLKNEHDLTI